MAQSQVNNGYSDLSQADLQDKTLWKLNTQLRFIYGKIGTFFTPGNQTTYPSTPTFQSLLLSGQTQPPTDPNAVLTRASADALYGPTVQRQALTTGAYPQSNGSIIEINPVQPIPTGGAGAGPTPPTPPTPGQATILKVLLTAPTLITTSAVPSDGSLLAVLVTQDATGHHSIGWNAIFKGAITAIPGTPNTTNVFWFVGVSGSWWNMAMPVLQINATVGGSVPGVVTGIQILKVLLTSSPMNIPSPGTPTDGSLLAVFLSQDGAGHHSPSWDLAYQGAPTAIPGTPGTTDTFWFVGVSGFWWLTGMPVLLIGAVP
jgi:hypothetical protein